MLLSIFVPRTKCKLPGMQDYNYIVADCFEVTLELSQAKAPPEGKLHELWEDNREALLRFPLVAALGG